MNLFELFVKIGVDDQASGKLKDLGGKLGNGLATAAKIGTAAVGAAAAGITALTTAAVNNYAEYEQLVGGVETLFKDSAGKIQDFADRAFQTAGLSANEYMSTVTSFSASLLQSLGGDTEKAADYADMAITDMADNANKMGTSMELIQNAYQGFAKQNYTMLDNLKLGYGGTKEEMARLIKDAAKLDKSIDANDMSFGNIVKSINAVQKEMGIYGTTAKEASATISGSLAAVKAQWNNLLTAVSQGDDWDLGVFISNFVDTVSTAMGNLLPVITKSLNGAAILIRDLIPVIVQEIPTLIEENLPILAEAAISIIQSLVNGISENQEMLMETAFETITYLAESLITMLPQIVQLGLDLIVSLANGIAESLPTLIPTIMDVIMQIVHILTDPANLTNLLNAALTIITELAYGLMDAIPQLVQAVSDIIINIADFLVDPVNLANILKAAVDVVIALAVGLVDAIPVLLKHLPRLWLSIIDNFRNVDWGQLGRNLVDGFKNGISRAWTSLKTWFKNLFGDLIGIAKKILGIASPSKVFKKIGGFTAEGFGAGFEDEFAHVKDDMEDALNFDDASVGINASIRKVGAGAAGGAFGGTSIGNININIDGAKYTDEQSLASAIALEIQNMTDRRAAVYA